MEKDIVEEGCVVQLKNGQGPVMVIEEIHHEHGAKCIFHRQGATDPSRIWIKPAALKNVKQ